jgi:DNA-binding LacI/PurR family transcriptional regulator
MEVVMAITIKDVAKLANVSPSTVSRVVANNEKISDLTKEKVFKAMKELNYKPNAIARSLANKRTKILGLIIPNSDENLFRNPFFIEVMRGISIRSQKMGYHIMYAYGDREEEEIMQLNEFVSSNLVDGIILLTATDNDSCVTFLKNENFPFVVIGRPENPENILWVDNDNFQAMYNVINYLVQNGHRDIGFIGGSLKFNFSKDRFEGYQRALGIRGIHPSDGLIVHDNEYTELNGYLSAKKILEKLNPSAIVTTDDLLAYGAKKYVEEIGKDITIVGFNNININTLYSPHIISVDINAEELGYHSARILIDKLEKKLLTEHYIVDTKLIDRS